MSSNAYFSALRNAFCSVLLAFNQKLHVEKPSKVSWDLSTREAAFKDRKISILRFSKISNLVGIIDLLRRKSSKMIKIEYF